MDQQTPDSKPDKPSRMQSGAKALNNLALAIIVIGLILVTLKSF